MWEYVGFKSRAYSRVETTRELYRIAPFASIFDHYPPDTPYAPQSPTRYWLPCYCMKENTDEAMALFSTLPTRFI